MLQLLSDENFNGRTLRALQRRIPALDVLRAQDTLPFGTSDPELLDWTSEVGRVVLTHDVATLVGFAYDLINMGKQCPGVIAVPGQRVSKATVDDLELVILASKPEELINRVVFIPL